MNGIEDSALILVDIQNDFCPDGALAVPEGDAIIDTVNSLTPLFPLVLATQDWHPVEHVSFKARGGPWPPHCVQNTTGADFRDELATSAIDAILRKGTDVDHDAYSGFEARDESGRSLQQILDAHGIKRIYVAGLATDYCVKATVLDGLSNGLEVFAIADAMRAVNVAPGDGARALKEMQEGGASIITSGELIGKEASSKSAGSSRYQ